MLRDRLCYESMECTTYCWFNLSPRPPGIRYVVDAGRSKQKLLEDASGGQVARYEVGGWESEGRGALVKRSS